MIQVASPEDFLTWTASARALLSANHSPDQVLWLAPDETSLWSVSETASSSSEAPPSPPTFSSLTSSSEVPRCASIRVPREFPSLARLVSAHAAPNRWEILYRVLWRLTHGEN